MSTDQQIYNVIATNHEFIINFSMDMLSSDFNLFVVLIDSFLNIYFLKLFKNYQNRTLYN